MMAPSGMPCTLPLGELSGVLMSLCASIQMQADALVLAAIELGHAGDGSRRDGVIATEHEGNLAGSPGS